MSYNLVEIDPISGEHKLKKVAGLSKLNVWTGTQSDYNAQKNTIPNGSYVNITDDAESGNGIKDIYSTDEVKTNKVWIDGKPIYRKVLLCTTKTELNVAGSWTIVSGWSETPSDIKEFVYIDTSNVSLGNRIDYKIETNKTLKFYSLASYLSVEVGDKLIIEYTKTS